MKRATDICLTVLLLPLWLPVLLAGMALVALTMGRPVFYVSERAGRDGKAFRFWKLRTMRPGEGPDEARLTECGKLLRRLSVDELPQLFHVLAGQMSLVGPRPLPVAYLPRYSEEQRIRHQVLPGITGWAQVNGRNAVSWEEKFELDAWYVRHRSWRLDLKILAMTARKAFDFSGISHEGCATMTEFKGADPGRGKFITFEGGEGCGKSTQIKRLAARLAEKGIEVVLTREPGGTLLNERIRTLIKAQLDEAPVDKCELLLCLAARAQLVEKVIRPALAAGKWVLSDRFSDSTKAYQGYGRGMDIAAIELMNDFACAGLKPDLTLLLDVPAEVAQSRMRKREEQTATGADRIEQAGRAFHERLRAGFLAMQKESPGRIKLVDASGTVETVATEIWKSVAPIV